MLSVIESYFSVLMLIGVSQAILSIYLLTKDKKRPFSNNMLALLVLAWGFSCYWFFAFIAKGALFSKEVTTLIGPMIALTFFPPIFLYAKYLFLEYHKFQIKDHLHFLPIYIYCIFTLYLYIDSDFSVMGMRDHDWYKARRVACDYVAALQGPIYFVMTNRIIKLRQQKLKKDYSEIESRRLDWFQIVHYSFAIVFIIGGISTILRSALINPYYLYMGYHAILAINLFYISTVIYKYPLLFKIAEPPMITLVKKEISPSTLTELTPISSVKTSEESYISKDLTILNKIEIVMLQQKLYTNPNLNLNDLSEAISESRNAISFALNNSLNKSFYNYINELRIAESKRLLSDESTRHFSIEGIAVQSGFKTMSVFYRFFKDIENVTPAVYRKQLSN